MRRGSILTRYGKPRFRTPQGYTHKVRVQRHHRGLGSNGEGRAGIFVPGITFPTVVTGAVVVATGMLFWQAYDSLRK